jgi:hypothetical protein
VRTNEEMVKQAEEIIKRDTYRIDVMQEWFFDNSEKVPGAVSDAVSKSISECKANIRKFEELHAKYSRELVR